MRAILAAAIAEFNKLNSQQGGQSSIGAAGGIIAVVLSGLLAYLVTVQLISGTALASNSLIALITTTMIPAGVMIGVARQFGFI